MKNVIIYVFLINIIGFLAMGIDKLKAKNNKWRIPESTLFAIALLGGCIGTIVGMYTFRHKTKKMKFVLGMPIILISEIISMSFLLYNKYFIVN